MARIALFLPTLGGGGAERVMLNLARGFCDLGDSTDLVVGRARGELREHVPTGVNLIDLDVPRIAWSLPGLVRYLRQARPDAFLSTMVHSNIVSVAALALARTKTRGFVREATTLSKEWARAKSLSARASFALVRAAYPLSDGIIAPSQGAARDLRRFLPEVTIDVIANPVITPDLRSLADEPVEHPFFAQGRPVFLAVGRLNQAKDYPTLLRALARTRQDVDACLVILGDGELRRELGGLIDELGLREHVSLPGFAQNPFAYMRRCSAYVLSSRWEGLPNVLIQALSCGCPIVATDCESGPREILDGGRLGTLVPVGDEAALAQAMNEVLVSGVRSEIEVESELRPYLLATVTRQYRARMLGE